MNKTIVLMLLASIPALSDAQESKVIKLQCKGTYNNYALADMPSLSVSGIYLEIADNQVKVMGAPGFDSTYVVVKNSENGIGFELESNSSYDGYLNRFNGSLSLMEKYEIQKDGKFKLKQHVIATCEKAKPIF